MLNNAGCPHGCNSLGQILFKGSWLPCPIHGKPMTPLTTSGILPDGSNIYDILQIPLDYRDMWINDISKLFINPDIEVNCSKTSQAELRDILETIYNTVAVESNLYPLSVYLYANPNLLDLQVFVYNVQRIGIESNLSVLPAVSVNNLAGLLQLQEYSTIRVKNYNDVEVVSNINRLAGEGADWNLRTGLTYTDYLRCSLCFVFDNASSTKTNLRLLSGFIEERSRRGLPTYVVSTAFFDTVRENMLYNKSGKRMLGALTPYLLLGRAQEPYAREHGWLMNKNRPNLTGVVGQPVTGYSMNLGDFQKIQEHERIEL